uniref:Macro domain-containing protein n=1 Tax=Euplotes crassus TaxID=5936 RepID=A0A7S3K650_EUPCR|mmetsp:Transcript_11699/g.11639  ORF Transcript_11699/g.11639 Transcript_11699/m.11639 type:complete len:346 (+) Transcript_11699:1244-2281(+)
MLMELKNDKQRRKDLIKENNKFGTLISEAQNSFKNYTKCDRDIETFEEKEKKYDRALKQVKDYKQDIEHLQDKKEYLEEFIKEHSKTLKKKKARKAEATDVHTFMYREARITVRKNDLVEEYVDAIVNPANEELNHAGGAARAIASKAGPEFEKECEDYISENYKLKTGSSMVTSAGGELKCDYVIHTVGPIYEKNKKSHAKECEQLKKCFESILKIMIARDFYDISIPAISTGIFGFPIKKCVEICAKTIKTTIDNNHKAFKGKEIILCNFDDNTTSVFKEWLQNRMEHESDDEDSVEERKEDYDDEEYKETAKKNEEDYSSEDDGALNDNRDEGPGANVDSDY